MGAADQFAADAAALPGAVDGEIGDVAAEGEIGERAGDADQPLLVVARAEQDVGVREHAAQAIGILHRPPLRELRALQEVDEFPHRQIRLVAEDDVEGEAGHGHSVAWASVLLEPAPARIVFISIGLD